MKIIDCGGPSEKDYGYENREDECEHDEWLANDTARRNREINNSYKCDIHQKD